LPLQGGHEREQFVEMVDQVVGLDDAQAKLVQDGFQILLGRLLAVEGDVVINGL